MQIIVFIAQKGGTGKTTEAINLACAALEAGHNPLIIDIDVQASACRWADRRGDKSPTVIDAQPSRLPSAIEKAAEAGFDLVLIDTPAKSGDAGLAAARVANLVMIPYRPQILDLETIDSTKDILHLAGHPEHMAVFNAVPPVGFKRRDDAMAFLRQYDIPLCPYAISHRAAFGDATALGQSVLEYEPEGKAAQEIREVYKHVSQLLGKQEGAIYGATAKARRIG